MIAETDQLAEIVERATDGDADQYGRHFRREFARVPHGREGDRGKEDAERLYRGPQHRHFHERHRVVEAANIAKLYEKKKQCRGVLKTRHDRLRRELDQCAELDDAKQRLQRSAEKNDGECNGEYQRDSAGSNLRLFRVNKAVDQDAEKKSRVDPGCVDRRRLVAERDADNGHDQRGRQSGNRAIGKVVLTQRREGEHSVAHRQRNGDCRRNESADHIGAEMP